MLCERCGEEIAAAGRLDADPAIDRGRAAVIVAGEYRRLSPAGWGIFRMLYLAGGRLVMADHIGDAIGTAGPIREHIRKLRQTLAGSGFEIATHRGFGYSMTARPPPAPAGRLANLETALRGPGGP